MGEENEDEIFTSLLNLESTRESLLDVVFLWSVSDILNKNLYKHEAKRIPLTFSSLDHYFDSFRPLLIEETHADLLSSLSCLAKSPACKLTLLGKSDKIHYVYEASVGNLCDDNNKFISYEPEVGDLITLTYRKPKRIDDLCWAGSPFTVAVVVKKKDSGDIIILSSKPITNLSEPISRDKSAETKEIRCAVFLINMTTNTRIWTALSLKRNSVIIKNVLQSNCHVHGNDNIEEMDNMSVSRVKKIIGSFNLNVSQEGAILSCIAARDSTIKPSVKLIWGPPGTGKTKTVGSLLFALLKLKCRTLTCAPTNIAVLEVAIRLVQLVKDSVKYDDYGMGNVVLLGNRKRMKIDEHPDILGIFLDHRVITLRKCFAPKTGWTASLETAIHMLNCPEKLYLSYLRDKKSVMGEDEEAKATFSAVTIEEFMKINFDPIGKNLMFCLVNLYKHLPTSFISKEVVKSMINALDALKSFERMLHSLALMEGFKKFDKELLAKKHFENSKFESSTTIIRGKCVEILESLREMFSVSKIFEGKNDILDNYTIEKFCLANSRVVLCTASSSAKLYTQDMVPFKYLVIDEAAQLKECESAIPLQLPGLQNAVLIGDERQLSALVKSKLCDDAKFGRSLFERLVLLGHKKHLLNVQYRMHPSISRFPNKEFYNNQILDAPQVKHANFPRHFLEGDMFGAYSFINIAHGKEDTGSGFSSKNLIEVAVISEIVQLLFKESVTKKQNVSVGIIAPYNAQVYAIQAKLENAAYDSSYFSVSARSVDGFQGGEEDVIIMSTVRCNGKGSVGFLANHQRTNVALTRARYCLWILGNEPTLSNSGSVWKNIVKDAKNRNCYYNADADPRLAQAITFALLDLNRFDILLNCDSPMFKNSKWKIVFSDKFRTTFENTKNVEVCKQAFSLLEKLASGWRKKTQSGESSSQITVEQYKVNELMCLVWTIDILKQDSSYVQVIKVWDMVPFSQVSSLVHRIEVKFEDYNVKSLKMCRSKYLDEGNLVLPMTWKVDGKSKINEEAVLEKVLSRPFSSLRIRE